MVQLAKTLEDIAKAIVDCPDEVKVDEQQDGDVTVLTLTVADRDTGKVIGQHGRVARAIRMLIKAAAAPDRVSVEIR